MAVGLFIPMIVIAAVVLVVVIGVVVVLRRFDPERQDRE